MSKQQHTTEVYDGEIEGSVQARCTCGWEGRIRRNIVEAGMEADAHNEGHAAP
ncbi:hypothetical protein [Kutzneria sp. NPDC051319]|uniref:hypothetical protein n=1 Tax=Kutzneria sp. NPDC051319 TaxID=3155047 RepID=UPI00341F25FD